MGFVSKARLVDATFTICLLKFLVIVNTQSIGCHTNAWDCDEDWYCSESQLNRRCQPCSKIAQFYCGNWTKIQITYKECAAFCKKLQLAEAEENLRNKSNEMEKLTIQHAQTELQLADAEENLRNKSKEMEKLTIQHAQTEENSRNIYWRDLVLTAVGAVAVTCCLAAVVWFLINRRRGPGPSDPEAREAHEMEQSLLPAASPEQANGATAPPPEEGYETASTASSELPDAAPAPVQCNESNYVTVPTQDDMTLPIIVDATGSIRIDILSQETDSDRDSSRAVHD